MGVGTVMPEAARTSVSAAGTPRWAKVVSADTGVLPREKGSPTVSGGRSARRELSLVAAREHRHQKAARGRPERTAPDQSTVQGAMARPLPPAGPFGGILAGRCGRTGTEGAHWVDASPTADPPAPPGSKPLPRPAGSRQPGLRRRRPRHP